MKLSTRPPQLASPCFRELTARVDVRIRMRVIVRSNNSYLDSDSEDSEDKKGCQVTDSKEQDLAQATTPALEILIASRQKHAWCF